MAVHTEYRCPTPEEMNRILWRARQERSAAMARFLKNIGAGIAAVARAIVHVAPRSQEGPALPPGRYQPR